MSKPSNKKDSVYGKTNNATQAIWKHSSHDLEETSLSIIQYDMKISTTLGWVFILSVWFFSSLMLGRPRLSSTSSISVEQEEISQYKSKGIGLEMYAISLPTLTVPCPISHFIIHTYRFDVYKKHLSSFSKAAVFSSPFLRNVYYVFISIHAP